MIDVLRDIATGTTLSAGWEEGMLEHYIERPEYGFTASASDDPSGTKFLRITDIQDGQVDWNTVPFCTCPSDAVASKRLLPGDVVVARIGATTGKSFFIDSPPHQAVFASYLIRLRTRPTKLLPRFLYFYMQTTAYWAHVDRHKGDRLKGGVNIPVLESLPIVVPPLDEQARIIRVLDCIHAAARSEAAQAAVSAELKRAALSTIFTAGLRGEAQKETEIGLVPASWDVGPLGSLGRVGNGSTPKKTTPAYWSGGTYPWLTSAKVYDREIVAADQFVTEQALADCHLPRVAPGAVLIAITGQGKTLGHCAVLSTEATVSQHIAYVATDTRRADPSFVCGYLETQYEYLRQIASGGGSTKGALTCAFLRELPIPLPPMEQQQEIVTILDAIHRKIEVHQEKRAALEALFKALLHKFLTGEVRIDQLNLSAVDAAQWQEATA